MRHLKVLMLTFLSVVFLTSASMGLNVFAANSTASSEDAITGIVVEGGSSASVNFGRSAEEGSVKISAGQFLAVDIKTLSVTHSANDPWAMFEFFITEEGGNRLQLLTTRENMTTSSPSPRIVIPTNIEGKTVPNKINAETSHIMMQHPFDGIIYIDLTPYLPNGQTEVKLTNMEMKSDVAHKTNYLMRKIFVADSVGATEGTTVFDILNYKHNTKGIITDERMVYSNAVVKVEGTFSYDTIVKGGSAASFEISKGEGETATTILGTQYLALDIKTLSVTHAANDPWATFEMFITDDNGTKIQLLATQDNKTTSTPSPRIVIPTSIEGKTIPNKIVGETSFIMMQYPFDGIIYIDLKPYLPEGQTDVNITKFEIKSDVAHSTSYLFRNLFVANAVGDVNGEKVFDLNFEHDVYGEVTDSRVKYSNAEVVIDGEFEEAPVDITLPTPDRTEEHLYDGVSVSTFYGHEVLSGIRFVGAAKGNVTFDLGDGITLSPESYLAIDMANIKITGTTDTGYSLWQIILNDGTADLDLQTTERLEYTTTKVGYKIPNKPTTDCSWFFIESSFNGTVYIRLSDYITSEYTLKSLTLQSEDTHIPQIDLKAMYICDAEGATEGTPIIKETYEFNQDGRINDASVTFEHAAITYGYEYFSYVKESFVAQDEVGKFNVALKDSANGGEAVDFSESYIDFLFTSPVRSRGAIALNLSAADKDMHVKIELLTNDGKTLTLDYTNLTLPVATAYNTYSTLTANGHIVIERGTSITLTVRYGLFSGYVDSAILKGARLYIEMSDATLGGTLTIGKICDVAAVDPGAANVMVDTAVLTEDQLNVSDITAGLNVKSSANEVAVANQVWSFVKVTDVYTITEDCGEHGSIAYEIIGRGVEFVATPENGYYVESAYLNGEEVSLSKNKYEIYEIKENITFKVVFVPMQVTIAPSENGSAEVNLSDIGFVVTVHADKGYRISKLVVNGESVYFSGKEYIVKNVDKSLNVEATFETYSVTLTSGAEGEVSYEIDDDNNVIFTVSVNEGYMIERAVLNGKAIYFKNESTYTIYGNEADLELSVTFKAIPEDNKDDEIHGSEEKPSRPGLTSCFAGLGSTYFAVIFAVLASVIFYKKRKDQRS